MELHHRCGVYACWNPDHLQIVTHAENMAFARNTAKSCCKRGHALSGGYRGDPGDAGPVLPFAPAHRR